jgi:hypothetical protein
MKDHNQPFRLQFLRFFLLSCLLVASPVIFAEVYKVTDEDGNVTYTDRAPDLSAVPVKLKGLSIISPQKPAPSATEDKEAAGAEGDPDDAVTSIRKLKKGYRDFAIVSPAPDQTFRGTENTVPIGWNTRYALQPGMKAVIYLDGEMREETASSMVNLDKVWRGTHEVYAKLIDGRNRIIATTGKVTFHMKQSSSQFNARRNQGG